MEDSEGVFCRRILFPVGQKGEGTFLINLVSERLEEVSGPEQLRPLLEMLSQGGIEHSDVRDKFDHSYALTIKGHIKH
jgi:hypothetical protein